MVNRIGQQLGNYQLTSLLGQGGVADVYLGEHIHLGTIAAIKVLQVQVTSQDRQQFMSEAQTIANLKHPNIIRMLDFGVESQSLLPYLVMEYAPNGTLRDYLPSNSALPLTTILPYVKQIAAALQYVHDQKLVHRDVKPENMLLEQNQHILLSDFGIVVVDHSTRSRVLQDKVGTPYYMAPEQIKGQPCSASDQYSLGIVVYEWLCGAYPFDGATDLEIAMKQLNEPPPALRSHVSALSDDVEWVVLKALAKDPQQRFTSVQAFATALEQASQPVQSQQAVSLRNTPAARPPIPSPVKGLANMPPMVAPPQSIQQSHRLRTVAFVGLGLILAISCVIGIGAYQNNYVNRVNQENTTSTAIAQATAAIVAANPDPYPPQSGQLALYDSLSQDDGQWATFPNSSSGSACQFTNGTYHVSQLTTQVFNICNFNFSDFGNFAFEVQMRIIKGDCGGIDFRNDGSNGNIYVFEACQNGTYVLSRYDKSGPSSQNLANSSSSVIKQGLSQTNLIAVVANGSTILLYVNRQQIARVSDSTYSHGQIGLIALESNNPTEVVYSNARVWKS